MSDKMSSAQWAKFRNAIKDVTDTFADTDVKIIKRVESLSAFNQNRSDTTTTTDFNYKGVVVYAGSGNDAQYKQNVKGSFDSSEGYVLINYEEFRDGGLIDSDGNHKMNEGLDNLSFRGKDYDIEGANILGPSDGQEAVVKIHFKRLLKKAPKV